MVAPAFTGLSAFPITPMGPTGRVDVECLGRLIERNIAAGVGSIGLLGSTGTYMFLTQAERQRACEAAVEAVAGRVPLVVGVGAMRTDQAVFLARHAAASGATGLLLAPVSYTPLTSAEVAQHYRAVAAATALPLCIYSNPSTTNFSFDHDLLVDLLSEPTIVAAKLPLAEDMEAEIATLRTRVQPETALGYSADWGLVRAIKAGTDLFFSAIGGTLPAELSDLFKCATGDDVDALAAAEARFAPLLSLCKSHGSLRVAYAAAQELDLTNCELPLPLQPLTNKARADVTSALAALGL